MTLARGTPPGDTLPNLGPRHGLPDADLHGPHTFGPFCGLTVDTLGVPRDLLVVGPLVDPSTCMLGGSLGGLLGVSIRIPKDPYGYTMALGSWHKDPYCVMAS